MSDTEVTLTVPGPATVRVRVVHAPDAPPRDDEATEKWQKYLRRDKRRRVRRGDTP